MKQNLSLLSIKRQSEDHSAPSYTRCLTCVSSDLQNSNDKRQKTASVSYYGKNSKFEIQKILLPNTLIHTTENLQQVLLVNDLQFLLVLI